MQPCRPMRMWSAPLAFEKLKKRVRDLERLLGRKTMENEILKEAIVVARLKKPILPQVSWSDREDGSR